MFNWTHKYLPVASPNYDLIGTPAYYTLAFLRQAGSFAVAAFLFVGGFFSAFSARTADPKSLWKSVRNRVVALLIPYTIWSVLVFIYQFIIGNRLAPLDYLWRFLTWGATGPYYYIPLLIYLSILAPLLIPLAKNRPRLLITLAFGIQFILITIRYLKAYLPASPTVDILSRITPSWLFLQWIVFFTLGMVKGFHLEEFKDWVNRHKKLLVVALPISLFLSVLDADLIFRITHINMFAIPILATTLIYTLAVILLFVNFAEIPPGISRFFYELGSRTYGIYLIHYTAMEITAKLIYRYVPQLLANIWLLVPILFVVGLGIPLLLIEIIRRTPLRKVQRTLIG